MLNLADLIQAHSPFSVPQYVATWIPGKTPFSTIESAVAMVVIYLAAVFGTKATMAQQPAFKMSGSFQVHNALLCVGSLVLLVLILEEALPIVWKNGLFHAVCAEEAYTPVRDFNDFAYFDNDSELDAEARILLYHKLLF
jgi:fatty acid elongase 3